MDIEGRNFAFPGVALSINGKLYIPDSADYECDELVIKTSYINPNTTGRAIAMLEHGVINASKAISAVISMEEVIEEISTRALSSKGKVIVKVNENLK